MRVFGGGKESLLGFPELPASQVADERVRERGETAGVYVAYLPNREHSMKVQALLVFLQQQIVALPPS